MFGGDGYGDEQDWCWYCVESYSSTGGYSVRPLIKENGTRIKEKNEEIIERCI